MKNTFNTNSFNMFYMDRGAKVSTVTPHTDLLLRGQRSKRSNYNNNKIVQD